MIPAAAHARAREILEAARVAGNAVEVASERRWGPRYLEAINRCNDALGLSTARVPGHPKGAPVLAALEGAGKHDVANALQELLKALRVTRNWMTVCGHISRDEEDDPMSYARWKVDEPVKANEALPALTDQESSFLDSLRGRDWTYKASTKAAKRVGEVSRAAVSGHVVVQLEQSIILAEETLQFLGLVVDAEKRLVRRRVDGVPRAMDLSRHVVAWPIFLAIWHAGEVGATQEAVEAAGWVTKVRSDVRDNMIAELRKQLGAAMLGVTVGDFKKYQSYRLVESPPKSS